MLQAVMLVADDLGMSEHTHCEACGENLEAGLPYLPVILGNGALVAMHPACFTRYTDTPDTDGGDTILTDEESDMTHYAKAASTAPIPCPDYSIADAIYIAEAHGLRYVVRNTHTGFLWATNTAFADVDEILWSADDETTDYAYPVD
jgi:hypothetical protein